MINNYKKLRLDCLLTLGGNGTHKTANLLSENGLSFLDDLYELLCQPFS